MHLVQHTKLEDEHEAYEREGVETNQEEGSPAAQEQTVSVEVDHIGWLKSSNVYHRFLCPKKALGIPVRMRMAPSTPNPGSSLVVSRIGAGEVVSEEGAVGVGVPVEEDDSG